MLNFIKSLIREMRRDAVFSISNELTYKILMAAAPFAMFLVSLLGHFDLDVEILFEKAEPYMPVQIIEVMTLFVRAATENRSGALLSVSLIVSVISAASGFRGVMRGINIAYDIEEKRGFFSDWALSVFLTLIFAFAISLSLATVIFRRGLRQILSFSGLALSAYNFMGFAVALVIIFLTVTLIYKLSCVKRPAWRSVLPGSSFTVALWLIFSVLFSFYVNAFSNYSKLYGSIGGVFIMIIWTNSLAVILLTGGEINALLRGAKSRP
ncbi:MAG: YihY/virulence factor BrkB family protein [Clostridiales bacterium]|jgi:membrane protein|nr:YihY/virulence factor BrkB family protein [Clostridiales bacterium]